MSVLNTKVCGKCNSEKSVAEFYAHKQMGDGLLSFCKACVKARVKEHRVANLDRIRAYDRGRGSLPHRRELQRKTSRRARETGKHAESCKRYQERYPEKYRAHNITRAAVRDGKLIRQSCWCGNERAEAHHPDYSRPLEVVWLCKKHHEEVHHS